MATTLLRIATFGVAAVVALASCTSSSDASTRSETLPTTTGAVAQETGGEFDPVFAQVAGSEPRPDEVQVALAREIVASDGVRIQAIDTSSGDRHVLLSVEAMAIGTDPRHRERFGSLDVGGDRRIVFETTVGDEPTHINVLTAAGERTDAGPGLHPAIRPDGRAFAFAGPNGVTAMWSHESVLDDGLEVAGSVSSMRFSPSGSLLAVAWEVEGRGGITIVEVTPNGFGSVRDLRQPTGRRYDLPNWIDESHLAVHDRAESTDEAGNVLIVAVADGSVSATTRLEDQIVDLDFVAGGVTALVVTTNGRLEWVASGSTGVLDDNYQISARW